MTNEELNTALYKKVFAEQEKYREWLLSQPPNEILNHCYEYTVREDIVLALEEYDLSDKQCKALLKLRMCSRTLKSGRPTTWTTSVIPSSAVPMRSSGSIS